MVRLSVPTIIMVVVGWAILLGMLLFVLDRYLDMRVVSYTADAQRQANNLLNVLLNNPLITKEKLIIDKYNLIKYAEVDWFSYPMKPERDTWENYSEIPEYDYNFSVKEFVSSEDEGLNENFGNLIFNMSNTCYLDYQKIKGYLEMPISLYDDNYKSYTPGIANLTLMKTPLAEISFWISQSSLRLEEGYDDEVLKSVRIGPEVNSITLDENGIMCMGINGESACKRFYAESTDNIRVCNTTDLIPKEYTGTTCETLLNSKTWVLRDGCKAVNINATKNSIDLIMPVE